MPTPITALTTSDTFNTWFNTTNTAINALNGISMYRGFAGDGIGITYTSSGNYTFSHADTVTTGVTFNGNINFNGTVTFAGAVPSISTATISITPVVSGLTTGNVVRVDSVLGLTFAIASSASGSEVLGIVVDTTASSTIIATYGSINNTGFAKTIGNILGISGGTLSPGQAYFLSPTVPGGITTVEPTSYGHVSKPILLGITGNSGAILPYRGILIEGISAGISAELDNKIVVQIDYSGGGYYDATMNDMGTTASIKPGDLVYMFPDSLVSETVLNSGYYFEQGNSTTCSVCNHDNIKLSGKLNNSSYKNIIILKYDNLPANVWIVTEKINFFTGPNFLGLVSKFILNTGTSIILEITTPGGSFTTSVAELDTYIYPPAETALSGIMVAECGDPANMNNSIVFRNRSNYTDGSLIFNNDTNPSYKFLNFIKTDATTAVITLDKTQSPTTTYVNQLTQNLSSITQTVNTLAGLTGDSDESGDLFVNGSFRIWQRGVTSLTTGSLNTFSTPFADRWFVIKNPEVCTGITLSVERQGFTAGNQGVLGGSPYYIDVACQFSSLTSARSSPRPIIYPRIEHIQKGAKLGLDRALYLSFWAKTVGGITGSIPQILVTRYADNPFADIGGAPDGNGITHSIQNAVIKFDNTINSTSSLAVSPIWKRYEFVISPTQWLHKSGWYNSEVAADPTKRINNADTPITVSGEEDGWFGIGFGIGGLTAGKLGGVTFSIAQVQLDYVPYGKDVLVDTQQELLKCEPYYQTTYELGQTAGCPDTTSLNHQILQLGNLSKQKTYFVEYPTEMVQSPVAVLYTPSGVPGDIFNVSANKNLLNVSSDDTYTYEWTTTTFNRSGAVGVPVAVSNTGKRGMNLSFIPGPVASLDAVKFHYTADADFKLQ